jgi:hypothetical protein
MYKLDTDNKDHNSIIFWFKTWENKVQNKDYQLKIFLKMMLLVLVLG